MNSLTIYARLALRSLTLLVAVAAFIGSVAAEERIWHIKAVHPDGKLLDVKALDEKGNVKALIEGNKLPVKVLVSDDKNAPVKAVGDEGKIYAIKAMATDGQMLDVKGVNPAGHIVDIKALGPDGVLYGIKSISPEGRVYDVKGVKMKGASVEMTINGVAIGAHIKALPQMTR